MKISPYRNLLTTGNSILKTVKLAPESPELMPTISII